MDWDVEKGWKMGELYRVGEIVDICKRGVGRYGRWLEESGWRSLHRNKLMCERRAECEASGLRWT